MNIKLLLIASLVLLFGLFVYLKQPVSQSQDMPAWQMIQADDVAKIVIQSSSGESVTLVEKQGVWYVQDDEHNKEIKANRSAVLRLRDDLADMQPIRMVAHGHGHDAALGFSPADIHVRCLNQHGKALLDVMVGKQGSDLLSTYIRRVNEDAIFAVDKVLLWQLKRTKSSWKAVDKPVDKKQT